MVEVIQRFEETPVRDERHLLRWMTRIARNKIRDDLRRRRERAFETLSGSLAPGPAPSQTPSGLVERREDVLRLAEAIELLAEHEQNVIVLRDLEALPHAEVAERLGTTPEAARKLHSRAVLRLGRLLRGMDAPSSAD